MRTATFATVETIIAKFYLLFATMVCAQQLLLLVLHSRLMIMLEPSLGTLSVTRRY